MKRSQKLLSLILMFCIFTTVLTGYTSAETLSEAPQAVDETFELPDIVDLVEASKNGYVGRVKTQEKDLYTFVFSNGNGTNTMRVYSHPVKYVAEDGTVRDISLDIVEKRGGGFVSADHEIVTTFESKLTDGISLAYNDIEIELVPNLGLGTVPSARSDGKSVTYDTSNTTSYVYGLTYAGFKEDIVVKEYTGQTEYSFTLFTNGLALYEEYGSYYLADAIGNVKANIGDIIVFTADERNNTMGSMTYETIRTNEEYLLTIHLDAEYLADEATVYPIRIDPTIEINYSASGSGAIEDVTINQNVTFSSTSGSLYVGRHPAGSLSRILMRFPNLSLSGIEYTDITAASVEIRDLICQGDENITIECFVYMGPTWSESGSTSWTSVGTDYLGPFIDSRVISYGYGDSGGQRYSFNVLSVARAWAFGMMSPLKGLVFKADDDFENQTGDAANKWYKTFAAYNRASNQPSLSISYNGDEIEPGNPGGDSGGDSGGGSEDPPEEPVTGTEYYIVFQSDGKMLTADSSYNLSTTAYSANNSYQKWVYTEVSAGVYVIRMKNNTNKCLTAVPGTSTITIANVSAGNTNQYWKMTILSGGNALQSQSTNKRLYLSGGSFTLNSSSYSSLAFIKVSDFVPCTSMTLRDMAVTLGNQIYLYSPQFIPTTSSITGSGWLTYHSDNTSVCTIDTSGRLNGIGLGTANITVTHKITGVSCSCTVNVLTSITYNARIYYDTEDLKSAEIMAATYNSATVDIYRNFCIDFNLVSTQEATELSANPCPNTSESEICTALCKDVTLCNTYHHKGSRRLIKLLTSNNYYTYRLVSYALCRYNGTEHSSVIGSGNIAGKNAISSLLSTPNLENSIQHELTHNLGASHEICNQSQRCTLNGNRGFWCDNCRAAILEERS